MSQNLFDNEKFFNQYMDLRMNKKIITILWNNQK